MQNEDISPPALLMVCCYGIHVQPSLAPLPALAMQGDAEFESNFMEPVTALEGVRCSQPRTCSSPSAVCT